MDLHPHPHLPGTIRDGSPESQSYPGLCKKKHAWHIEGGNSSSLLCSFDNLPEVLHPALGSPVQERHGPVGAGPEEGHKNGQRDETPLL